ncbi:MAG: UDP-N-acetylmuramoyl-L-alanyl-D-glutamate--2,6-diaminopimelate ligase, partial [Deltaproteobacteria bacterium]|nr:UDP-N-acetylmuramoyl-L-alanyl-D-glutamate--2,6-diaminopimelate ligase [Deltaproteobacteria bacterium]
MHLAELLASLPAAFRAREVQGNPVIGGLCYDSRAAAPGDLFVALVGHDADGHDYLDAALERGAVAALVEDGSRVPPGLASAVVPDTRRALAPLATHFFGVPAGELALIGITG